MRIKHISIPLAFILLLSLLTKPASAADVYYYGAVNYWLNPAWEWYMPVQLSSGIYIPSQLLDDSDAGITVTYNKTQRYLTVYNTERSLHFNLDLFVAFDSYRQYDYAVIENNGIFYLPLDAICSYFDISYTRIATAYGTIIRIKTAPVLSSDADFVTGYSNKLAQYSKDYERLHTPPSPAPQPSGVTATPTPSPKVTQPPILYVSFDVTSAAAMPALLDVLDSHGILATFFFTEQALKESNDVVRRVIGTGHSIGILGADEEPFFESPDAMLQVLQETNERLRKATLAQSRLVRVQGGSKTKMTPAYRDALAGHGYRLWDWTISVADTASSFSVADSLLEKIEKANGTSFVRLSVSDTTVSALRKALPKLAEQQAVFHPIAESQMPVNFHADVR